MNSAHHAILKPDHNGEIAGMRTPHTFTRARLLRVSAELQRCDVAPLRAPACGWIRYVRDALNMTAFQLGRRAGIRQQTMTRHELNEREGTITLRTLRRIGNAIGCELVYALVPRTALTQLVDEQARRAADVASQKTPVLGEADELARTLQVRMPRWLWGSWEHPELWERAAPLTMTPFSEATPSAADRE